MPTYFTIAELTKSATATRLGIDNTPPNEAVTCLQSLITNILDPVRRSLGMPIFITSGYRSPKLNQAVGGSATSQHQLGQAADITAGSRYANARLFWTILRMQLPFDQLIWEYGDSTGPDWIHISHKPNGNNRRKTLHVK